MTAPAPGTIEVFDELEEDVPASAALLFFQVTGSRLFTGTAALREAVEVRRLVEALINAGLHDKDVRLEGVTAQVSRGLLTKSSSATYRIRATLRELSRLTAVIDAVAELRNCELTSVDWEYEAAALEPQWLERAIPRARVKAEAIARAIGRSLGPVLRVQHQRIGESLPPPGGGFGAPMAYAAHRGRSVAEELSAFELAPTCRMGLRVLLVYGLA